jgi:hypothetical protein
MFENILDWKISIQAPVKWRRFNDYPVREYPIMLIGEVRNNLFKILKYGGID